MSNPEIMESKELVFDALKTFLVTPPSSNEGITDGHQKIVKRVVVASVPDANGWKRRCSWQELETEITGSLTPIKRLRNSSMTVKSKEMNAFFKLFENDTIQDFLWMDRCAKIADKYLLAMVFAYFKRAELKTKQYTKMNFFIALYLANDMEEDEEDYKYEIFPWALGKDWRHKYTKFLYKKDRFWKSISFRAAVSRRCCEEIMAIAPYHVIWKRNRALHHGGAFRTYDSDDEFLPRGPSASPVHCEACAKTGTFAYTPQSSSSADSSYLFLSSCTDTSSDEETHCQDQAVPKSFDMTGLQNTLQTSDDAYFWASKED
ncbi:speedy protein A-like isoform X2 [Anneissia japonica]|uniref:speedy protein A-like isoform X2 n=1 Tax=Anneissia japonica TaxID=1529436 RepID=UPI0014255080|nr:speedy protein A-like isoform X2 [Anneissia japonica]